MARRSLLAAALASVAVLALGSPTALAQDQVAEPVLPDSTATITPEPAAEVTPELVAPAPPQDTVQDVSPASPPETAAPPPDPAPAPAPAPVDVPFVAVEPEEATPAPAIVTPPPVEEPANSPAAEVPQPAAEVPQPAAEAPADSSTRPSLVSSSVVSNPSTGNAQGAPARTGTSVWTTGLEQALPAVKRDLRRVQADVESIRRQLRNGATPPVGELNRLRSTLERLEPILTALNGSPHLLHRVQLQLAQTQVSTAELVLALRRSGLRGPALNALLRELESFGGLGPVLDLGPSATPFASMAPATGSAPAAGVAPALPAGDSPSDPRVASPSAGKERQAPAPDAPAPWPAPADSSFASASDALSVGGAAALMALLIAFFLPRLTARLELAPGRGHIVASVLALERPG